MTPEEANRTVYFDFEGFKSESPSLIGILVEGHLDQVVLDPRLASAAKAKGLRTNSLVAELQRLKSLAISESRRLVAFTTHESKVAKKYAGLILEPPLYVNAHQLAKRWRGKYRPEHARDSRTLTDFLSLIDCEPPKYHGIQKTTARLRPVISQLERHGDFDAITPVAKAKWTKVLQHNEHDCRGMAQLVKIIAHESAR